MCMYINILFVFIDCPWCVVTELPQSPSIHRHSRASHQHYPRLLAHAVAVPGSCGGDADRGGGEGKGESGCTCMGCLVKWCCDVTGVQRTILA